MPLHTTEEQLLTITIYTGNLFSLNPRYCDDPRKRQCLRRTVKQTDNNNMQQLTKKMKEIFQKSAGQYMHVN